MVSKGSPWAAVFRILSIVIGGDTPICFLRLSRRSASHSYKSRYHIGVAHLCDGDIVVRQPITLDKVFEEHAKRWWMIKNSWERLA
jgi:hypothetical protein